MYTRKIPEAEIKLLKVERHRNGVAGAPFDVAIFKYEGKVLVGVLFEADWHCAILSVEPLQRRDISNEKWRGDYFEPALRSLIRLHG
jgi:hypothetical protein